MLLNFILVGVQHGKKSYLFFKGKNKFIEYNELMVQDIDNNDDWQKAKIKFNFLNKR